MLQRAARVVLGASLCALATLPASARARKIVGVPGWTRGSQTFLRSRPGDTSPTVAKVPRHTKVYVWGTFEGWYRVETSDHIFGWIHYSVLNAPSSDKLIELSHRKAILASNRTAPQPTLGTLATSKRNTAATRAQSSTRNVSTQAPSTKPVVPVAATTTSSTTVATTTTVAPAKTLAEKAAEVRALEARTAAARAELVRAQNEAARAEQLKIAQQKSQRLTAAQILAHDKAVALEQQRIAKVQADAKLEEAAHQARLAQQQLDRQMQAVNDEKERQNRVSAYKTQLAKKQMNAEARRQNRIASWKAREAAKQKRLALRQKRVRDRQQRLAMERTQLRNKLGTQVGTQPNVASNQTVAPAVLRPLTPAELMKAREAYLNGQKKSQPGIATNGSTASVNNAPTTSDSASDNGQQSDSTTESASDNTSVQATPSVFVTPDSSSSMLSLDAAKTPVTVAAVTTAKVRSAKVQPQSGPRVLASRGGSPMARYVNRGGSPRDYARNPGEGSLFGQTMVKQALSYRGMPYIMGAASPSRGFDCSGLIYFMLRQRGYNPPRTAEGLSHFGIAVARNQLQPGDILLFANTYKRGISHAGIYMGNGNFVHAANSKRGVTTNSLYERYYASKYWGARRVK